MPSDAEFCPVCGTILPLPGDVDFVVCYNTDCKRRVNVAAFDSAEVVSVIQFNKVQTKTSTATAAEAYSGPMVDRRCSKCGSEKMSYTTRQTRSVDEGQTVFYLCPVCNNQESEYS